MAIEEAENRIGKAVNVVQTGSLKSARSVKREELETLN
jgi:hypothetical protein